MISKKYLLILTGFILFSSPNLRAQNSIVRAPSTNKPVCSVAAVPLDPSLSLAHPQTYIVSVVDSTSSSSSLVSYTPSSGGSLASPYLSELSPYLEGLSPIQSVKYYQCRSIAPDSTENYLSFTEGNMTLPDSIVRSQDHFVLENGVPGTRVLCTVLVGNSLSDVCETTLAGPTCVPTTETCDGVDNDCDGFVDETFTNLGAPCSVGEGSCEVKGVQVCSADQTATECNAIPLTDCNQAPVPVCGNGILEVGEMCDGSSGIRRDIGETCTAQCKKELNLVCPQGLSQKALFATNEKQEGSDDSGISVNRMGEVVGLLEGFNKPYSLSTIPSSGTPSPVLYFLDDSAETTALFELDLVKNSVKLIAASPAFKGGDVAVDSHGALAYVIAGSEVKKITLSTGTVENFPIPEGVKPKNLFMDTVRFYMLAEDGRIFMAIGENAFRERSNFPELNGVVKLVQEYRVFYFTPSRVAIYDIASQGTFELYRGNGITSFAIDFNKEELYVAEGSVVYRKNISDGLRDSLGRFSIAAPSPPATIETFMRSAPVVDMVFTDHCATETPIAKPCGALEGLCDEASNPIPDQPTEPTGATEAKVPDVQTCGEGEACGAPETTAAGATLPDEQSSSSLGGGWGISGGGCSLREASPLSFLGFFFFLGMMTPLFYLRWAK